MSATNKKAKVGGLARWIPYGDLGTIVDVCKLHDGSPGYKIIWHANIGAEHGGGHDGMWYSAEDLEKNSGNVYLLD